ncbi:hypothetical protein [Pseudomonas putida]|uniref:Uncharacterized protein n=1 Tax=Pseudomonas putida TaxID=303 RepID=A0A1Y3KHT4_PSEPU|nr:hypothetical protein [Pseudomonas putida]OUM22842.1 hypothetical protein B8W72_30880 [Pseudomonas putida]
MLSKEEFVDRAFAIAAEMAMESEWAIHIPAVDGRNIRFKNGKNVNAECLCRMYPDLLQVDLEASSANPVMMAATKNQGCVNVPMREIARRVRAGVA